MGSPKPIHSSNLNPQPVDSAKAPALSEDSPSNTDSSPNLSSTLSFFIDFLPTAQLISQVFRKPSVDSLKVNGWALQKNSEKTLMTFLIASLVIHEWAKEGKQFSESWSGKAVKFIFPQENGCKDFEKKLVHLTAFLEAWGERAVSGQYTSTEKIFRSIETEEESAQEGLKIFKGMLSQDLSQNLGYTRGQGLSILIQSESLSDSEKNRKILEVTQHYLLHEGRAYTASDAIAQLLKEDPNVADLAKSIIQDSRSQPSFDDVFHFPEPEKMMIAVPLLAYLGGSSIIQSGGFLLKSLSASVGIHGALYGISGSLGIDVRERKNENPTENPNMGSSPDLPLPETTSVTGKKVTVDQLKEKAGLILGHIQQISDGNVYRARVEKKDLHFSFLRSEKKKEDSAQKFSSIIQKRRRKKAPEKAPENPLEVTSETKSEHKAKPIEKKPNLLTSAQITSTAQHYLKEYKEKGRTKFPYEHFFLKSELFEASSAEKGLEIDLEEKLDGLYSALEKAKDQKNFPEKLDEIRKVVHDKILKNYTRDKARFIDCLLGKGCNCEGETIAWVSIFYKLPIPLEKGQQLGVQVFKDHIQPVIYNKEKDEVLELVSGKIVSHVRAPIYATPYLFHGYLKGHEIEPEVKLEDLLIAKRNVEPPHQNGKTHSTNSKMKFEGGEGYYNPGEVPEKTVLSFQPIAPEQKTASTTASSEAGSKPHSASSPSASASASVEKAPPLPSPSSEGNGADTAPKGSANGAKKEGASSSDSKDKTDESKSITPEKPSQEKETEKKKKEAMDLLVKCLSLETISASELPESEKALFDNDLPFSIKEKTLCTINEVDLNRKQLVFQNPADKKNYLALKSESEKQDFLYQLFYESFETFLEGSSAQQAKAFLKNPLLLKSMTADQQHSIFTDFLLKIESFKTLERDLKLTGLFNEVPALNDLIYQIGDFNQRLQKHPLEFLLFLDTCPPEKKSAFLKGVQDFNKLVEHFGELPNRDPKAPKARLQKWPFFEILKNRPLLGVFGNTKTEPKPEDFFPIDLDVTNGGDIKEVGAGKSDRKIPVPENPLKIDDKKRASTSPITPENFIQAELMVQLLFASFDFYQENKYENTSTNNERGRMIISYEDQALAKNMEQALLHWTPELSAAFIKMNQTGKYDLEFKRLLPKLADERAQRDSKLNAKLSLYALVNRTKMNPESASAEQAIRSLGQPKDLLLILDSIENRKKTPSTEINKMEILDKVLVKQIYELLPTSPELRIDLEPKDK